MKSLHITTLILHNAAENSTTFLLGSQKPNLVGYNTSETPDAGKKLLGGSFITVGSKGSFKLSDLKVDSDGEYTSGDFELQTLTTSGATKDKYCWFYNKKHGGTSGNAGWYDPDGEVQYVDDTDVEFEAGSGFWTAGSGLKLVCNGQVLTDTTVKVGTPDAGKVLIGNPFPVDINLVDLFVDSNDEYTSGDFEIQTLTTSGATQNKYCWFYNKKHGGTSGVAGWYDPDGEVLYTREDNIILPAGGAYWVAGSGLTLVFPQLNLK